MMRKELLHTLSSLWKHPHMEREQIVAFQNRKLRCLVRHAYDRVPYYRRLFDQNRIRPGDIQTADDLWKIPLTEKNHLKTSPLEDILDRGVKPERLVVRVTSGSSGRPFLVRRSPLEEHVINMFRIRAQHQFGRRLRDRTAYVAVAAIPGEKRTSFLTRLRHTAGVHRTYPVDCLQPAEAICRRLEEIDPDIISGYAGAVARVASRAAGGFTGRKLRYVTCGGEALTPSKRRTISQVFAVPVFDVFGAHECNIVAWECSKTGRYHVCDDNVIAQVVRDGRTAREGETGEVVITALHSYAMPFIRYRMGDMVEQGSDSCPCGQPFSTFRGIAGRVREYFLLPDGRWVHPLEVALPIITEPIPWLDQFQLLQETKHTLHAAAGAPAAAGCRGAAARSRHREPEAGSRSGLSDSAGGPDSIRAER